MTYDEKLEHVLRRATAVFAEKGCHRPSIRDIARATGISLAGRRSFFDPQRELLPKEYVPSMTAREGRIV